MLVGWTSGNGINNSDASKHSSNSSKVWTLIAHIHLVRLISVSTIIGKLLEYVRGFYVRGGRTKVDCVT